MEFKLFLLGSTEILLVERMFQKKGCMSCIWSADGCCGLADCARKRLVHCARFFSVMVRLVIRAATPLDVPWIVNACLTSTTKEETKGFAADEWVTFSSVEELRKVWVEENRLKHGSEVVVAERDGKVIGFIVFKLESDHVYIDNIDVVREEQRKGVGKALVTHVESLALASGYSLMKTDTTENAEGVPWKSYGFWTKMGYGDTGERLPTKWDFKTIPFVKRLENSQSR